MHGLVGTRGPGLGQGQVQGSQAWPSSLETGPGSPSGSAVSGSPPKLKAPEPRIS